MSHWCLSVTVIERSGRFAGVSIFSHGIDHLAGPPLNQDEPGGAAKTHLLSLGDWGSEVQILSLRPIYQGLSFSPPSPKSLIATA